MDSDISQQVLPATIATGVEQCMKAFEALCSADLTPVSDSGFMITDVMDQFDRFKVWTGNIAAHRKSRASLDYRLRDTSQLRELVLDYLTDLEEYLTNAIAIVNGERIPWDAEDDQSSTDDDDRITDSNLTELQQITFQTSETITCFMRLSMTIRNPVPQDLITQALSIDVIPYQRFDIAHVQEKYAGAEEYLTSRLGEAISRRRHILKQWSERHERLSRQNVLEKIQVGHENTTETVATSLPSQVKEIVFSKGVFDVDADSDTGVTRTSFASTFRGQSGSRPPPLPIGAVYGVPFECNLCFKIILVVTYDSWKKHVYRDLNPYVCTFKDCSIPNRLFGSRRDWFQHEMTMHRGPWKCSCGLVCCSIHSISAHLRADHRDDVGDNDVTDLIESMRCNDSQTVWNCPLCTHTASDSSQLQKHLGRHFQELALFALPVNVTEDEPEDILEAQSVSSRADQGIEGDEDTWDTSRLREMESSAAYFAVSRQDLLGKAPIKPARNVYFIALKDTNLMMYDNSEKLEVRHAIPLENYDVDMLPDARQEDITGSYIRLYPRSANGDIYCLFSNNYVEKTTCYRALQWACGSAYDGTFDKVQDEHLDESEEDSVTQTSAIETADESDDDYVSPRFAPEHQMPPSPFSQAITHVQPQSPDSDTGSTALSISSTADISEDDVTSPIKPSSSLDHARYVDHPDIQQGPDRRPKDKAIDTPSSLEYATKPLDGDSAGAINPSTTNIDDKGFDIGDVEAGMSTDYQAFSKDRASQVSETEARSSVTFSTVSGISRPLTQEEAWLLYDFETHCRDCRHCISPYKRFQSGAPLCHKGKHMSYHISESMYMQKSNVFERYHHHTKPMRVEIPHTYTYLREQLHAMEDAAAIRHARRQTEEERPRVGVHNDSQRHSDKPLVSSSTGTVIEAARTDDRRRARYRHEPHEQTKAPLELEGSPLHGEARLRALDASVKVREQNYRAQDRRPTWAEEDVRARQ